MMEPVQVGQDCNATTRDGTSSTSCSSNSTACTEDSGNTNIGSSGMISEGDGAQAKIFNMNSTAGISFDGNSESKKSDGTIQDKQKPRPTASKITTEEARIDSRINNQGSADGPAPGLQSGRPRLSSLKMPDEPATIQRASVAPVSAPTPTGGLQTKTNLVVSTNKPTHTTNTNANANANTNINTKNTTDTNSNKDLLSHVTGPEGRKLSNKYSVHWGSDMSSRIAALSRESLMQQQQFGLGTDMNIPSLYDIILDINCDCGLSAFFHNLVKVLETHFGAERVSICLPTDATDIVNMPWGLKALWNKSKPLPHSPYRKRRRRQFVKSDEEDGWHTDEDEVCCSANASSASNPQGNLSSAASSLGTWTPGNPIETRATASSASNTEPSRAKFSLPRKLSRSWRGEKRSDEQPVHIPEATPGRRSLDANPHFILFDQLRTLEWEADPLIDTEGIANVLEVDGLVLLQRKYETSCSNSTAAISTGPKAGTQSVNGNRPNLTRTSSVTALRKFSDSKQQEASPWARSPAPSPAVREFIESPFFNTDTELENAFSQGGGDKPSGRRSRTNSDAARLRKTRTIDTATGGSGSGNTVSRADNPRLADEEYGSSGEPDLYWSPIDAIGYENTYSLIHILIVVPSRSAVGSSDKPAPIGILSIMSNLIPYPGALRALLDRFAPHIATSFMQANAHSSMATQLESYREQNNRPISPLSRKFPSGTKALDSIDKLTKFYSSLSDDQLEDLAHQAKLEIVVGGDDEDKGRKRHSTRPSSSSTSDGKSGSSPLSKEITASVPTLRSGQKEGTGSNKKRGYGNELGTVQSEAKRPLSIIQRRLSRRPHIGKFLYSYGSLLMTDPDKSLDEDKTQTNRRRSDNAAESKGSVIRSSSGSPDRERIRPSNRMLRTIIDAIPVHVFTAEPLKGSITWVSNRTLAFRGQTYECFCRMPEAAIHPDDKDIYVNAWDEALRTGIPISRLFRVRRFDGRYRDLFLRAVPLRDEKGSVTQWFCTMMDIHNEHQAELQATRLAHEQASENKYRVLAESTPIIVFMAHPKKGLMYANSRWFAYSGASPEETYGVQYLRYIHPDDRDKAAFGAGEAKEKEVTVERGTSSVEMRIQNVQGEYRWHLVLYTCSDSSHPDDCTWFGTATDIHDHRLIQDKLQEAKDAAQRTIESKSRFLSNMSHEIRTPLIGISGMISFLLDTPLSEEQLDYCHTIASSSEALLMVINDILDLSKVESGKMNLTYVWFPIRRLVEEVNELLSSMAISKRLELNYIVENSVPVWLKGDRVRIRQVMLNLIGNAIKFTDQGEIYTHCCVERYIPETNELALRVEVHDTGRGFTKDDASRMFKPYSQLDAYPATATTASSSGTGLGLVISRQLVELHGGQLTCTGVKNVGSTFQFTCRFGLPTEDDKPTEDQVAKAGDVGHRVQPTIDSDRTRILVACPWKFTCESIAHHIRATVNQPDQCEIRSVGTSQEIIDILENDVRWTHILINLSSENEIVQLLQFLFTRLKREICKFQFFIFVLLFFKSVPVLLGKY